jgi:hypothetical protein
MRFKGNSSTLWSAIGTSTARTALLFIPFLFTLVSCSANWHLRKAIAKDPTIIKPQVITLIDTVIVTPAERVETSFVALPIDTITIERERLRIKIRRIHDTLIVDGECKSDTIRITETIEGPPVIKYTPRPNWERWLIYGGIGLLAFRLLSQFLG